MLGIVFHFALLFLGQITLVLWDGLAAAALITKPKVLVQEISLQNVSDQMIFPGRVRSKIEALVNAENEGLVQRILKPVGSSVQRGESVLIIQNTDPVYKFAPVPVRAPTQGFLSRLDVSLMSKVEKGASLFLITDPRQLKIEIEIPAADLGSFAIGTVGKIKGTTEAPQEVRIVGLSPLVDVKTGTASAQLEISPPPTHGVGAVKDRVFRAGMIVQVQFDLNPRQGIVLPSSAIVYRDRKPFVQILENGKVMKRPVVIRSELGGTIELVPNPKDEISQGQKVVIRANRYLADGDEVEIDSGKIE
ncbi:MAG: hypothetical protein C5B49_12330 [Bdellovibrio sp.]|nr:MAG: hypothetical protein C5B49_12330 [Bdellovibrio sp.]